MRERFTYPVRIVPAQRFAAGETCYVLSCRYLPECQGQGETIKQALTNAAGALEESVAARILAGLDIPRQSRPQRGERLVAVAAQTAAKAALALAMREARITKIELARRLGCDEKDVRRLLDPRHGSRLAAMAAALSALGKQMVVTLRDAA